MEPVAGCVCDAWPVRRQTNGRTVDDEFCISTQLPINVVIVITIHRMSICSALSMYPQVSQTDKSPYIKS